MRRLYRKPQKNSPQGAQNAAETVFASENVIPPAAAENAPTAKQDAPTEIVQPTDKSLYNKRDGKGGWGKKYGTAMEAVNDAIKAVNPQLSAAMEQEVYGGATNTPITNAIIAAQEDVRQSSISPMQAAEYISNIYNSNGVDGLNTIFNPKTGNLYGFALSEAKQISASPLKPIPTGDGLGAANDVGDMGAKTAEFGYDEAPTQTHSSDSIFTPDVNTQLGMNPAIDTHKVNHDVEVDAQAKQRYDFDYEGEKSDLFGAKQDWDDADTALAHMILESETNKAIKSGAVSDAKEVARLKKIWNEHGTSQGQAMRQRSRFANTPAAMVADALNTLYGEDSDVKVRKLSPRRKAGIMETVKDMADRYNKIERGDTNSLVGLIEQLNEVRRTTGMFSKKTSKLMDGALRKCADGGTEAEDFLRSVAAAQIRNIAGDYAKISPLEAIKNFRIMGMLSKVATVFRNFVTNNVFDPLDSLANNISVPLDIALSKITGTRSTAVDKSWFSKEKRQGSMDGAIKSFIQVGLDADVTDSESKYEQRSGRVFKMSNNPIERLLSTWSKFEGYALQTTDEFQKGGIKAETERGLNALADRGLVNDEYADARSTEIAKQRTFQNEGALSSAMLKGRDALNSLSVTDKQGGSLGAGDVDLPFVKVPANITAQLGNYSPIGAVNGVRNVIKTVVEAKQGTLTPELQAKAVTGIGRGLTGTAFLAACTALALNGILDVAGSDDDDEEALQKASGLNGTQINLSALERWFHGESTEYRDGDDLQSIGFLEPLNGLMAAGSLIADSYVEDGTISVGDIFNASIDAVFQSVMDLPAMSTLTEMVNGYKCSRAEKTAGKLGDAATSYAASQAASFLVPNFVGGIATGMDNTMRDQYASGSTVQRTVDSVKAKVPGLRQTLPAKLDNFGRERTYAGNTTLNMLNSNILPGQITNYKTDAVNDELYRLGDTGEKVTFPEKAAPKSVNIGEEGSKEKVMLNADERRLFQQTRGKTSYDILSDMVKSAEYKKLSDAQKAEVTSAVNSYSTAVAAKEIASQQGKKHTSDWDKYADAEKNGIDFLTMYLVKHPEDKNGNGRADQKEQKAALNALAGLTPTQKAYIRKSIK
jgi:hypothetical protein